MIRLNRHFWMSLGVAILAMAGAGDTMAQQIPPSMYQEMHWRLIGPFRGGRTRAACGVPSEPNVFYMGQVNGGVWKSDDYGRTWNSIFDKEPTQSIGAIAVAPSDPKIIYVASGEGLARPDLSVGDGIYKSTDAGKTWTHVWTQEGIQMPAIAVDPHDPNKVFAAVLGRPYGPNPERGLYLSTDGGSTWKKVLTKDENTGASDIEIDPSNPDVVYASMWQVRLGPWEDGNEYNGTNGGLFKSTDGGNTWRQLTKGLPDKLVQLYVAIAPSDSKRLYATVAMQGTTEYGSGNNLGFYRSDDGGDNWYRATTDPRPALRIGGGDLPIPRVDPKNPDVVYSASTVTMKSSDGGKTWMGFRGAPGGDDYQNLWINPEDPKIILLVSDQGALVSVNGGDTWSSWYNQPTAQLYHVSASNTFPYKVCAGQQESGSVCISTRGNDGAITYREWHPVGAIEYGYVVPDPLNPDIVYGAGRTEVSKFHWSTGESQDVTPLTGGGAKYRADRTQPIMFSPVDPHVLYAAWNYLFKTTDGGQTWQAISPDLSREHDGVPASVAEAASKDANADKLRGVIYSLAPSFKTLNTIWAGTDDGLIWVTHDAGKNWKNVTPPKLTPWSKVSQLSASHFDDETAYTAVNRFRIDDMHPYIYRTHDGGKTWQKIVNGLPDSPVNTVREDPVRKGLLFAGTETSVWISFDDGDHWQSLQLNLPHTSMRDLWIHDEDLIVATHGRSFWVLDDLSPLEQVNAETPDSSATLFKPATAIRVRRDTYSDTPLPPDEPMGENPPDGAVIDYTLGPGISGAVSLDVVDEQGKVVRKYSSTDKPEVSREDLEKQLIPLYWIKPGNTLSVTPGMHRWVWDMHYTTPDSLRHEYPISAVPGDTPRYPLGPIALPGKYTVRLLAGGKTYSEPLTVKMDPRVKSTLPMLQKMFQMERRLSKTMTQTSEAIQQSRSLREQLDKVSKRAKGETAEAISDFEKKLTDVTRGGGVGFRAAGAAQPTLSGVNGEASALYGEIDRADAAPTAAQDSANATIEKDFVPVMKQWDDLKATDLPALNQKLHAAKLPEIRLEAATPAEEEIEGDVE
ncbi:MAG TPA: hypothetical protein VJR23_07595 [Candidatus Acidoferrales bacterium]|nr:hypothetical protein [Candidatus Acidoferrales bacterium]